MKLSDVINNFVKGTRTCVTWPNVVIELFDHFRDKKIGTRDFDDLCRGSNHFSDCFASRRLVPRKRWIG